MSGRKDEGALEELSVAAMNRLRASLGLAPLCAPAPAATGPDAETVVPAAETPDAVAQRAAAAERAADARRTRELRARTQGLGAAILAEEGGVDEDAEHWLARTQARHAAAAAATTPAATTPEPRRKRPRGSSSSAADVRLAAHAERLAEGLAPQEDVVLTLRDTGVLDAEGDDVNGAADVLENAAAAEAERRARAQAEARRTPASAKYDDDEFAELRAGAGAGAAASTADTGTGVAAEFYTSEEMAQLFRRKRRRAASGSGRSSSRRTTADSVAGAALEELLGDDKGSGSGSGSGDASGVQKDGEKEAQQAAVARTREEEERARVGALERLTREQRTQERAIARERREALVRAHADAGVDEDDEALYRALARTRAAAQQRAQQPRVEERIVQALAAKQEPMDADAARPSGSSDGSSTVVVDDVSSFLTKIEATTLAAAAEAQQKQQQQQQQQHEEQQQPATTVDVKQEPVDKDDKEDDEEDEEEDEEPFAEQPLYSVSAALAQLSRRGGVDKVAQNSTVLVGRQQDGVFDLRDDPAPHLKLEYLDADGQQLRPKEAHRLMSYIFHGRKPHQKKLEKLARQKAEARRVAEMESTDTPLHAVAAMERLQHETKQPYLVLSGKGAQASFLNLKKE